MHSSPGSPDGAALPSSPTTAASVEGIGSPMVPRQAVSSGGLMQAAGLVSVSP